MKVTDLISLNQFFESLVCELPAIKKYLLLSNGEKAVDEISSYYTDHYKGTTAFFQIAETLVKGELMTFQCSLTIATKPANVSPLAGLQARNLTSKLMLELLGKLELMADETTEEIEDEGDMYECKVECDQRIFPIGLLANVHLEGYYVDIDVTIPATHSLYPA